MSTSGGEEPWQCVCPLVHESAFVGLRRPASHGAMAGWKGEACADRR